MTATNEIRSVVLDYFAQNGHEIIGSSSLVPKNDPTLLFTNSGMVQFKNVFTGGETRPYTRAVTSQKCVRAGGKHNDLENVGYTARHHTFFEMLGNFSFGDYFKDVAIELAWNLLTREFSLPKERLLVTVYSDDDEAAGHWRKIAGIPESKIIRIATSDNFWSMGETGPCGPCSEVFYDHGENIPGGPPGSPTEGGDRFIEIWNLVFMQFEQIGPGKRVDLPKRSVDTGLGLERIAAVLQGKHDNYDIDMMRALVEASAEISETLPDGKNAVSHRVIADHLRACSFLIADGVLPSNEGRGYVLRRIMRRAMRHAHLLGCREPLLHRLVPALVSEMGDAFGELVRAKPLIGETFKTEEERFRGALGRGLEVLEKQAADLSKGGMLDGAFAFKLYDTYGFPLDLTQDILRARGISVDTKAFDAAMELQRAAARKAWAGSGEAATEQVWFDLRQDIGATDFLGYDAETVEAEISALVIDGQSRDKVSAGKEVALIVNQSPFYGESGGQIGDTGMFVSADGAEVAITDTQKRLGDLHVHLGKVKCGTLAVGDAVELRVDSDRRKRLRANHSATHLLHEALRRCLGEHVTQKGSLVSPDRLRFDISHPKPVTAEELAEVEFSVNERIRLNTAVQTTLMSPEAAVESGALALFGEKYGEEVRVVRMGDSDGHNYYSTELCGGTHVRRTGDIGLFRIIGEGALAAGVRRIEALTGVAAIHHLDSQERLLREAAGVLKTAPGQVPARVASLLEERKGLEREVSDLQRKVAIGGGAEGGPDLRQIAGLGYVARIIEGVAAKDLRGMADELKKRVGSGVVVLATIEDGKASLVVGITEDLTERFSAVDLVRLGVTELGGKGGGGRPDMAQGGGPNGTSAQAALSAIERALAGSTS